MRVGMYYNNKDVRVEEVPLPEIGPGEIIIRILASGICGSDVMEWYRLKKAPLVLGHEIAGEVADVGEGVKQYTVGDRVSASHHVPCNTCYYCLNGHPTACDTLRSTNFVPGGFAEYVKLPSINVDRGVYRIPREVSFEEATFTEPLACVLRGFRMARMQPGQSVLVIGSGIAGIMFIDLARAFGAGCVMATDIVDFRLKSARRFGAEATIRASEDVPAAVRQANNGRLADQVIVCTGAPSAILQGFESVERGGCVLLFAPTDHGVTIPISVNDIFFRNDVTVTTSYAGSPADHELALELIRTKRVRVGEMITHRFPLEEIGKAFRIVAEAKDSIKVIIEPHGN